MSVNNSHNKQYVLQHIVVHMYTHKHTHNAQHLERILSANIGHGATQTNPNIMLTNTTYKPLTAPSSIRLGKLLPAQVARRGPRPLSMCQKIIIIALARVGMFLLNMFCVCVYVCVCVVRSDTHACTAFCVGEPSRVQLCCVRVPPVYWRKTVQDRYIIHS